MSLIDAGEQRVLDCLRTSWPADAGPPLVIDVGANRGDFVVEVKERLPVSTVLCFEPQASAFELLKERVEPYGGVALYKVALGHADFEGTLRSSAHEACVLATLTDRREDVYDPSVKLICEERIEVRALDSVAEASGIERVDFLKIDAEGHDFDVLVGGGKLLMGGGLPVIQFEYNGCAPAAGIPFQRFWDLLHEHYALWMVTVGGEVERVAAYDESHENSVHRNYLAVRHDCDWFQVA